jgi:hypothetical protein
MVQVSRALFGVKGWEIRGSAFQPYGIGGPPTCGTLGVMWHRHEDDLILWIRCNPLNSVGHMGFYLVTLCRVEGLKGFS